MNTYSINIGMERSSQIPWQDDCYMVLKSTPKPGNHKKMEGKTQHTHTHTLTQSCSVVVIINI